MEEESRLEETDQIREGSARVPPVLWVIYLVLIVVCVIYFFANRVRPA